MDVEVIERGHASVGHAGPVFVQFSLVIDCPAVLRLGSQQSSHQFLHHQPFTWLSKSIDLSSRDLKGAFSESLRKAYELVVWQADLTILDTSLDLPLSLYFAHPLPSLIWFFFRFGVDEGL